MKLQPENIKKIAVFRALQLGDMLCAIPAIRALRQAYPDASITLVGLPWARQLLQLYPQYFDEFIMFPGYPGLPERKFDAKELPAFLSKVQGAEFDLVLQMHGSGLLTNPLVSLFAGKHTAGFFVRNQYMSDASLYLQYPDTLHEVERHIALMEHLGIPAAGTNLEFPVTEQDRESLKELYLPLDPGSYVCIHPGSRDASRQWPVEHFARLGDHCAAHGLKVVITGTQDEWPLAQGVAAHMKSRPYIVAGKTSLAQAGALLEGAFALISNCTGVSHIAAALKTPSVVISMDGEPERWTPMNKDLHLAVDWTKTPDFGLVLEQLQLLISYKDRSRVAA